MAKGLPALTASPAIESIRSMFAERGLAVEQVDDPAVARENLGELLRRTDGDAKINVYLDPHLTPLTAANAFWLFIRNREGEIVGKLASRIDDVGEEPWGEYASRVLRCIYRENNGAPTHSRWPNITYELRGRIIYFGDAYFIPSAQHSGIAPLLFSLYYLVTILEWGVPDSQVAYVRPHQAQHWSWCRKNWHWTHETEGFSKPAQSEARSRWFGVLDRQGFWNEVRDAQDFASKPLRQEDSQRMDLKGLVSSTA